MKRIYRSETDRKIAGIAGGMAEYFNIDPVLMRVIWIVFILCTGFFPGLFSYIILIFIIPNESEVKIIKDEPENVSKTESETKDEN